LVGFTTVYRTLIFAKGLVRVYANPDEDHTLVRALHAAFYWDITPSLSGDYVLKKYRHYKR